MTNAELMVAIKQDLNAAEDMTDIDTKIGELEAEAGVDNTEKIATLNSRKTSLGEDRAAFAPLIAELTGEVTITSANALTIESRMFNSEAAIRLSAAQSELAELDALDTFYSGEIETFKIYASLGDKEAATNIKRLEAAIAENDKFRTEANAAIAAI